VHWARIFVFWESGFLKFASRVCVNGVVWIVLLFLFMVQFVPLCFAGSSDEAGEALERAEQDLGSAFAAVAEAEGAGADVSVLLDTLDIAGGFLSEAHVAFSAGNYESAFSLAVACSSAVDGVAEDAARLKVAAEIAQSASFFSTLTVSGIGVGVAIVCACFVWWFLKRRYFRRVLDMKPEVEVA
jgi:hypothetical protein